MRSSCGNAVCPVQRSCHCALISDRNLPKYANSIKAVLARSIFLSTFEGASTAASSACDVMTRSESPSCLAMDRLNLDRPMSPSTIGVDARKASDSVVPSKSTYGRVGSLDKKYG